MDFAYFATRIPRTAALTFEIDQHEPDETLSRAIEVLRDAGILSGEKD